MAAKSKVYVVVAVIVNRVLIFNSFSEIIFYETYFFTFVCLKIVITINEGRRTKKLFESMC